MAVREEARVGFDRGAAAYERGRPGYCADVLEWLVAHLGLRPGRTVLDVGAGTGKLTRELVATGASVVAVEPVRGMREILERAVPQAHVLDGTAEALPVDDDAVDAITIASAFHWFDAPRALTEFHRVLTPGGRIAMVWNRRRADEPVHRAIDEIIEPYRGEIRSHLDGRWRGEVEASGLFAPVAEARLPFEQRLDRDGLLDRIGSISFIAFLPAPEREAVLDRMRALAASLTPPICLGYTSELFVYERR